MKNQMIMGHILWKVLISSIAVLPIVSLAGTQSSTKKNYIDTISQKKGIVMEPRIIEKSAFKVIGIEFCIDVKIADYTGMWNTFIDKKTKLTRLANGKGDYGLFHRICEDGKTGYFLGVEVDSISNVLDGFKSLDVKPAQYAVFECNSETVGETWPYIHGVWLPNSKEYVMANSPVFEFYPPEYGTKSKKIYIHIPVQKKE